MSILSENNEEVKIMKKVGERHYKLISILFAVLVVAIVVFSIGYNKRKELATSVSSAQDKLSQNKEGDTKAEENRILGKIRKIILTPEEVPTFLTIVNAETLTKEQSFFQGSINGDVLVVFGKSQKAIIYSPSRNLIVNSGPILANVSTTSTQSSTLSKTKLPVKK